MKTTPRTDGGKAGHEEPYRFLEASRVVDAHAVCSSHKAKRRRFFPEQEDLAMAEVSVLQGVGGGHFGQVPGIPKI